MYCPFCGVEIPNSSAFCGFCGKKIPTLQAVNDLAVESVEKAAEAAAEPVTDAAEKAAEAAAEPVTDAAEKAVEAAAESVTEAAEKPAEAAAEPVTEAAEKAVEAAAEPVTEAAEKAADVAAELVTEAAEKAVEAAAEPVTEAVEKAVEAAAEHVTEAAEKAADVAAESVTEAAGKAAESVPPAESVTYSETEDAAFEEFSDNKNAKARRAFNISALLKNKLFLICAAAFLVFVILIIIAINAAVSSSDKNPLKGFYYSVYADGETVFLYNGSVVKGTDFSKACNIAAISEDGTAALVIDGETLTLLSGGKINEITDDLSMGGAALSANGKTVVYVSDGELLAYSNGKKSVLADLGENSYTDYVISPDGGTVVFSEYNSSYSIKSVSAWKSGKVTDLDAKFKPVAVSNGGKIVYGIKNDGDLVYLKNLKAGSDEKIREISGIVETTADNSGIIFSSSSSTYYFDSSMSEAAKLISRSISVLDNGGYPVPHDNFKNFYALGGNNGVYKFSKKGNEFENDKIISGASRVKLSADGKTFVYKDGSELVKVSASNTDKEDVIGDDVYSYSADPSLKYIYFLDEDGELRFASSKKTKISSDVKSYTVNYGGVCVFCNDEGDLYYSSKGGEKKKAGISDVEQITFINGIVYVRADGTLYVSENGKNFKKTGVDF